VSCAIPYSFDAVLRCRSDRADQGLLAFFSTTTVFGTPVDVTLAELAIESFFPADGETAEVLRRIADGAERHHNVDR
jgi:hypothetical protein